MLSKIMVNQDESKKFSLNEIYNKPKIISIVLYTTINYED